MNNLHIFGIQECTITPQMKVNYTKVILKQFPTSYCSIFWLFGPKRGKLNHNVKNMQKWSFLLNMGTNNHIHGYIDLLSAISFIFEVHANHFLSVPILPHIFEFVYDWSCSNLGHSINRIYVCVGYVLGLVK